MSRAKLLDPPPAPPAGRNEQPKRWAKKDHPQHPGEKQWSENPGYETKQAQPIGDTNALARWINDMTDWGLMMHDEVVELRERVRELEARCPPQK